MKLLVVLCLVAAAMAQPQRNIKITQNENYNDGLGSYRFSYQQDDEQYRQEEGDLKNAGRDGEALVVRGSFGWVGPDNEEYKVNYVADENGYHPTMDRGCCKIPAEIAKLLGIN